ncbi:MAG: phosphate ABC transporter permease subunit PstC [Ignavibacteriae bacterium]|nr:phosphate ABC transporter permease subunit PstC [Ignavibacteriota bacterium]
MSDRRSCRRSGTSRFGDVNANLKIAVPQIHENGGNGVDRSNGGPPARLTKADLQKRFRWDEFLAEKAITAVAFVSLAAIVLIFVFVFREAAPILAPAKHSTQETVQAPTEEEESYGDEALGEGARKLEQQSASKTSVENSGSEGEATWSNLLSVSWQPVGNQPKYGLWPLIVGSLKVTVIALLVAAPLAILAALFTSSFAPRWSREYIKPAIELLAGFPSVVVGFFALVTLATLMQDLFGYQYRLNVLLGGIAMALAVIPIVYTVAEDALMAVPKFMTEASLALGATRWQTALFVTLPAATPGVFAAVLLGFGRAFGETMIVLMATGNAALFSWSFIEPVRTMSATIGAEMAEVVFGETHYHVLFFIGAVLFVFTFVLNAIAEVFIRQRLLKRFRGAS